MIRHTTNIRGKLAIGFSAMLLATALTTPLTFAAEPGGSGSAQPNNPTAVYTMHGDSVNPTGSSYSYFETTSPGSGLTGAWHFGSTSTASNAIAVTAFAANGTNGTGVFGAGSGNGLYGSSTAGNGVYGTTTSGVALFGVSSGAGSGFYGFSTNGPGGVMGSNTTEGARFYTRASGSNKYAIVTGGLPNSYGNVYIGGNYQATGTKSARVETNQGPRLMYATEGTQNIFSDQGTGTLVNGHATITIDPLYAQTVNLKEDYQVFLTPRSADTYGVAVVSQNATSFEVRELHGGTGSFKFNWKIEGLRKGYEQDRLEDAGPAPASGGPAYEMPTMTQPLASQPNK